MADGFAYRMTRAASALGKLGESLVSKEKEGRRIDSPSGLDC